MSDLVLAAFAAETGAHVVEEPRARRFERFRQSFDEAAFRSALGARGLRFVGRGPSRRTRRCCASSMTRRLGSSSVARVTSSFSADPQRQSWGRERAHRTERRSRGCSAGSWRRPGSSWSAALRVESTARRTAARSRRAATRWPCSVAASTATTGRSRATGLARLRGRARRIRVRARSRARALAVSSPEAGGSAMRKAAFLQCCPCRGVARGAARVVSVWSTAPLAAGRPPRPGAREVARLECSASL